jgi:H+/Cl- antiporter ClcA
MTVQTVTAFFITAFKWFIICTITGLCAGSASAIFLISLEWVTDFRETHTWIIALLPLGGLLIGLLYYYYGKGIEGGNKVLVNTIEQPGNIILLRKAPFIYAGTLITHLLGGSAGREGTALQMAGAMADQLSKPFKLQQNERRILLAAAIAAGFGSVFGTPLAGAVFALEVFSKQPLRFKALLPVLLAAFIANAVTTWWQVAHTNYKIDFVTALSLPNILYAITAGVAFGACARLFIYTMQLFSSFFKSIIKFAPLKPVLGGTIIALAVYVLGTTKYIGLGIPTIVASFIETLPAYDFALKLLLTAITLSTGFKGGEVTPLFFMGATLGNALGYLLPLPVGLLAGMGFVAVFAGATHAPLACTIMAMELFGAECSVYVFVACMTAYFVSGKKSIYYL